MTVAYRSGVFGDAQHGRAEYEVLRSSVVADYRAATGRDKPVRLSSDVIVLESFVNGSWVRHTRGLAESLERVGMYQKAGRGMAHRWLINVSF